MTADLYDSLVTALIAAVTGPGIFVHIAAMFYVAGFLVRDQLVLRLLILIGTLLYMFYYLFVGDTPLWDAFIWSAIMGGANLLIICLLVLERTTFALSVNEKKLFEAFVGLSPGEVRKILKIAKWQDESSNDVLTVENELPQNLHYVISGECLITKKDQDFTISRPTFIGEIAYTLNTPATATVRVRDGGNYVSLPRDKLKALEAKNPGLRVALHALFNADLALKVAHSTGE